MPSQQKSGVFIDRNRSSISSLSDDLIKRMKKTKRNLKPVVILIASDLQAQLKRTLSKAGTGRVYFRGKVKHRASAPGHPPAVDLGILRNSIHYVIEIRGTSVAGAKVGTPLKKGRHLEYGTKRMAPRPWLRSTARRRKKAISRQLRLRLFK